MRAKIFRGTVLLISGDTHLQTSLQRALLQGGYGIRGARNQEEALQELQATTPAILVVDRRESGFSRLRLESPKLPPLVTITYHPDSCDEQHCTMDLEDGATNAVCNAGPSVIVALVGAVLRRQRWERPAPTQFVSNGVTVNLDKCEVTVGSQAVSVSRTEFRILQSLVAAPGHYLSRKALLDQAWGEGFAIFPHTLDVHISSLRRKLNPARTNQEFIMTVKGLGFKLRSTMPAQDPASLHYYPLPSVPGRRLPLAATSKAGRSATLLSSSDSRWQHQTAESGTARHQPKTAAAGQGL
ncbi:hypothetical protein W02_42030 [Nitrospira sp. KM1]|uniref:response regulator transcription factor n=1 Tax=Nitrospira sp. KM1 TaxID=1936990 RepID=UPI0013A72E2A|nr:response regulator transcription factor [Nitrospira sp. KM1]BCA57063.1 hypothetical protein W02_42030 [Nitrospira sp. KM1]